MLIFSSRYEVFDKTTNTLQHLSKNIIHNNSLKLVLSDIANINIESNITDRPGETRTFRLSILMKDGQKYPITPYLTSGLYRKKKIAKKN